MINNLKGVIFDFNGTLFFDNDKHVKAWGAISQLIRGHAISDVELHKHFNGVPNNQIIHYMLDGKETSDDLEKYSKLKEEYYRQFCKEDQSSFHLVKGTEEYFDSLKNQNIPFTIASASIKDNIDFFVQSFNLDKWIKPSTIVYDNGTYENKIAMFKDAAKIIGVPIEECLVLEDSASGINNAYQAGCRNIIVIDSANKKDEYSSMPGVIQVIDDLSSL